MPAVARTVIDGSQIVWSSRLVQVDDSAKLTVILGTLVSVESVARLQRIQAATSDQHNVARDNKIGLHIEFGRRHLTDVRMCSCKLNAGATHFNMHQKLLNIGTCAYVHLQHNNRQNTIWAVIFLDMLP